MFNIPETTVCLLPTKILADTTHRVSARFGSEVYDTIYKDLGPKTGFWDLTLFEYLPISNNWHTLFALSRLEMSLFKSSPVSSRECICVTASLWTSRSRFKIGSCMDDSLSLAIANWKIKQQNNNYNRRITVKSAK